MESNRKGIIIGSSGGLYTVDASSETIHCRARGVFRHNNEKPLVGDRVELSGDGDGYVISEISERKNSLIRPPMANLDLMFIVCASASPTPDVGIVDKMTAIAEYNSIKPIIIIGKSDLDGEKSRELEYIYRSTGYDVFVLSTCTHEGCDSLCAYVESEIRGRIAAFAGVSGVGKSSLMNMLFPGLKLETGNVSDKISRGKHTTRSVTLYPVLGGYLADTPGFSMIDFEHFDFFSKDDLSSTFPEIRDRIGECRYTKCSHTKEDGCAVIAAVEKGDMAKSRHQSYCELFEILKNKHSWDK